MPQFIAIRYDLTHENPSTVPNYVSDTNQWLNAIQDKGIRIINISVAMSPLDNNVTRYSTTVVYEAATQIE